MAIEFEFVAGEDFHFAAAFADHFQADIIDNQVILPETLGTGTIKEIYLSNGLDLCMHRYELKQPFVLRRVGSSANEILTIKFDGRRASARQGEYPLESLFPGDNGSSVEIGTSNLFTEITMPQNQAISFLVISITRGKLLDLLQLGEEDKSLRDELSTNPSFVFYENMTWDMERILNQLGQINDQEKLATLLYQVKAQELIYHLFAKLLIRPASPSVSVHQEDAEKIYELRAAILADISLTPQLPQLAPKIGMSHTKMKQLFRQIFGDSIYNYYQTARMNEAARLLTHLSVSEAGYKVGFTNLSHFARLFERHYQMKPKRYKDTWNNISN